MPVPRHRHKNVRADQQQNRLHPATLEDDCMDLDCCAKMLLEPIQ
jgi:hypothetical protein